MKSYNSYNNNSFDNISESINMNDEDYENEGID